MHERRANALLFSLESLHMFFSRRKLFIDKKSRICYSEWVSARVRRSHVFLSFFIGRRFRKTCQPYLTDSIIIFGGSTCKKEQ